MPVAQGGPAPARQAVFVGLGALLGLVALLFLITQADRLFGQSNLDLQIGDGIYRPGPAEDLAEGIADTGPFLLPGLAGRDRDLYLVHLGDVDDEGWRAFAPRPLASPRDCVAEWIEADRTFVDSCDGTVYPEDGEGLPQYPVSVDGDGLVSIDLNAAPSPTAGS